jgi:CHAT domain-containing protein
LEDDTVSLVADLELQLSKLDARPNIRRKVRNYAAKEDDSGFYIGHTLVVAGQRRTPTHRGAPPHLPETIAAASAAERSANRNTILFLAANPGTASQRLLDEECAGIELELSMSAARDDFNFRSKWAVTVDEMMRHLVTLNPTVVHFSGHSRGNADLSGCGRHQQRTSQRHLEHDSRAGIYLQDERRQVHCVDGRALTQMISSAAPSVRVVVLNACFSDDLAALLCSRVDCVVGMRGALDDGTARSFAVAFYRGLGNSRSVANALAQAVATLAAKQLPGEHLPICRTRAGISADHVILSRHESDRI